MCSLGDHELSIAAPASKQKCHSRINLEARENPDMEEFRRPCRHLYHLARALGCSVTPAILRIDQHQNRAGGLDARDAILHAEFGRLGGIVLRSTAVGSDLPDHQVGSASIPSSAAA